MQKLVRRHLGKVVAGAAIAAAATAAMVAVTLPGDAGAAGSAADPRNAAAASGGNGSTGGNGADGQGGQGADAREQGAQGQRAQPGVVERAPEQGKTGTGRDPLTDDELRRAQDLALPRTFRNNSEDVKGDRGPERLLTELAELGPDEAHRADPPRRAQVTLYDYKNDTFVTKIVNLGSGEVEKTDVQRGVQPPPSHNEAVRAAELLIASPHGKDVKSDYRHAMGKPLTGPGQLTVTGFVYRGLAEGPAPGDLRECGRHRCVRLFTKVRDGGPWIDTRKFVIDLSAGTVNRLT
ncbi:Tat pathway signal sequence domain protein [Streptomyces sp. NPDC003077]|uniref:Tat pathway signal sequence domain protein n=1 Tax=Streptomyces sp. NPDC003077 TaxID=3154443 RepID=UPI0033B1B8C6